MEMTDLGSMAMNKGRVVRRGGSGQWKSAMTKNLDGIDIEIAKIEALARITIAELFKVLRRPLVQLYAKSEKYLLAS